MPTPAPCQACHAQPDDEPVNLEPPRPGAGTLTLCGECFARRQARVWDLDTREGRRLRRELDASTTGPRRFSYLLEDQRYLHLVRLNPDWVERHQAPS